MNKVTPIFLFVFGIIITVRSSENVTFDNTLELQRGSKDDVMTQSLDRLKMLARITNGIYLQYGLTNGAISTDEVVSEILNIRAEALVEIRNTKTAKVRKILELLSSLSRAIEPVRNSSEATSLFQSIELIQEAVQKVEEISKWNATSQFLEDSAKLDNISSIQNLTLSDSFSSTLKMLQSMDSYETLKEAIRNNAETERQIILLLKERSSKISEEIEANVDSFNYIKDQYDSRSTPQNFARHSFGFPNGLTDLQALSTDFTDPWVKGIIRTNLLYYSLSKLATLGDALQNISNQLDFSDRQKSVMFEIGLNVHALNETNSIEEVISGLRDCCVNKLSTAYNLTRLRFTQEELKNIGKKYEDLERFSNQSQDSLNSTSDSNSEHIFNISSIQDEFQATLERILTEMQQLEKNRLEVENDGRFFKCLQEKIHSKLVKDIISFTDRLGQFKENEELFVDGVQIAQVLENVAFNLEKLSSDVSGWHLTKGPEFEGLEHFTNSFIHSEIMGFSVQGLVAMKTVIDEETRFRNVIPLLKVVEEQIAIVSMNEEDMKNLKSLASMAPSLEAMYSSLNRWKESFNNYNITVLLNYSSIFENARLVTGISLDLFQIENSIDNLIDMVSNETVKETLKELGTIVEEMNEIGLNFSKYSTTFEKANATIEALDVFFVSFETNVHDKMIAKERNKDYTSMYTLIGVGAGVFVIVFILGLCYLWRADKEIDELRGDEKQKNNGKINKTSGSSSEETPLTAMSAGTNLSSN